MPKWRMSYKDASRKDYRVTTNYMSIDGDFFVFYDEDINLPKMVVKNDDVHYISDKDAPDDDD